VSSAAITLCVSSQQVFIVVFLVLVYFVTTQSGNFWIHPHISKSGHDVQNENSFCSYRHGSSSNFTGDSISSAIPQTVSTAELK